MGELVLRPPLLVALLAIALYLPSSARIVQLSNDMVEYVDIARRLVDGEGYRLGIKAYHVGGSDVVHDGLYHRPPLLTVTIAALFWLGFDLHAVQASHTLIAGLAAALVYSIGSHLYGRVVGVAAGILAATSPVAFKTQVPLMTEGLSTVLTLLGVYVLIRTVGEPTARSFALAGVAFGLGYLARPPVLLTCLAAAVAVVVVSTERRRLVMPLAALVAGVSIVVVPMSLFSLATRGRLIYSGKTYLYAVISDRTVIEEGLSQPIPTPGEFIAANAGFIVDAVLNLASSYARWLFLDPEWLLLLLPAWPVAIAALLRGRYPRAVWISLAVAAANYVFYALTWSSWQDRFLLPTLLLLLPLGVDGVFRGIRAVLAFTSARLRPSSVGWPSPTFVGGLFVVAVAGSWLPYFVEQYQGSFTYFDRPTGTRVDAGLRWTGPPRWVNDDELSRVSAWLGARTELDAIVAAGQPWPYAYFTRRPAVLIPLNLSEDRLRQFIVEYRVAYMLIDQRDRQRRPYRDYLEKLADDGVRVTRLGAIAAFDTRVLWDDQIR